MEYTGIKIDREKFLELFNKDWTIFCRVPLAAVSEPEDIIYFHIDHEAVVLGDTGSRIPITQFLYTINYSDYIIVSDKYIILNVNGTDTLVPVQELGRAMTNNSKSREVILSRLEGIESV